MGPDSGQRVGSSDEKFGAEQRDTDSERRRGCRAKLLCVARGNADAVDLVINLGAEVSDSEFGPHGTEANWCFGGGATCGRRARGSCARRGGGFIMNPDVDSEPRGAFAMYGAGLGRVAGLCFGGTESREGDLNGGGRTRGEGGGTPGDGFEVGGTPAGFGCCESGGTPQGSRGNPTVCREDGGTSDGFGGSPKGG